MKYWIPVQKDSQFVAAFDAHSVVDTETWVPLRVDQTTTEVWNDCTRFSALYSDNGEFPNERYSTLLTDHEKEFGEALFLLVSYKDPNTYYHKDVMNAVAEFLLSDKRPLHLRIRVVHSHLQIRKGVEVETNNKIGLAIVRIVLAARKENCDASMLA